MKMTLRKSGQSIVEYAILLVVVASAIVAMYTYINRAVQGRLKQIDSEVSEPILSVAIPW